ncbi:MAG: hypothetical protein K2X99_01715 [Gemmatimonadaceae bacterium]|nr:hypothetical protein [Gemmatimonadaceae bacterium]
MPSAPQNTPPPIPQTAAQEAAQAPATAARDAARQATQQAARDAREAVRKAIRTSDGDPLADVPAIAGTESPPVIIEPKIPEEVIPIMGILFGSITVMVVLGPFARAIARRIDRSTVAAAAGPPKELERKIDQLQQSLDTMAIEIERISEGQRFTSKLMAERVAEPARLPEAR